jgi:hypothetical protein
VNDVKKQEEWLTRNIEDIFEETLPKLSTENQPKQFLEDFPRNGKGLTYGFVKNSRAITSFTEHV